MGHPETIVKCRRRRQPLKKSQRVSKHVSPTIEKITTDTQKISLASSVVSHVDDWNNGPAAFQEKRWWPRRRIPFKGAKTARAAAAFICISTSAAQTPSRHFRWSSSLVVEIFFLFGLKKKKIRLLVVVVVRVDDADSHCQQQYARIVLLPAPLE